MTRGARLLLLPVGGEQVASVRYRVLAYLPALRDAGFTTKVRFPLRGESAGRPVRPLVRTLDLIRDMGREPRADLLFVHRKTYPPIFAARLRRAGVPLVFDMDDALDLPPPLRDLAAQDALRYARNFEATTSAADLVICGNSELASRLPHDRYEILPTPIDTVKFSPGAIPQPTRPTLGWVGHSDNLGYLESIAEPLREVGRRHAGMRLVVVADRAPEIPGLEIEFRKWTLSSEVSCFSGIGVGLMPLGDTPWARAKCAFKAIQYMSLGIPAVASPVGMNVDLFREGENGFLAGDDAAWVAALDALLSNPTLSARIGAEGRRTVERDYSLDVLSRRLVAILRGISETSSSSRSRA